MVQHRLRQCLPPPGSFGDHVDVGSGFARNSPSAQGVGRPDGPPRNRLFQGPPVVDDEVDAPVRRHRRTRVNGCSSVEERRSHPGAQGDAHCPVTTPGRSDRILTDTEGVGVVQEADAQRSRPDTGAQTLPKIDPVEAVELADIAEEPDTADIVERSRKGGDPVRSVPGPETARRRGDVVQDLVGGAGGIEGARVSEPGTSSQGLALTSTAVTWVPPISSMASGSWTSAGSVGRRGRHESRATEVAEVR